ncbi:MAG TPA: DUF3592 domain-containing protein [Streptosporangiaceae bacterium]
MGGGAILYSDYVIIGTIVIFAACIGATWSALQLRNSLTLTGDTLIVRTATKTHKIPFQQVTYVSAGAYGIYIRTSDGLRITSLVAENSRWSQRFGLKTKASGIADVINDAIGAGPSRGGGPTGVRGGPTGVRGGRTGVRSVRGGAVGVSGARSCASGDRRGGGTTPSRAGGPIGEDHQGLRADDGARRGVPHWRVRRCRGAGRQRGGVARTRSPGPGTVMDVSTFHMDVRYVRDGKPATARINLNDSSDAYHKGDHVTVIYDPAHPDRARTIREDGQNQGSVLIMVVLLVAGAFLLIGGISNLIRARRQLPSGVRAISLLQIHGRAS